RRGRRGQTMKTASPAAKAVASAAGRRASATAPARAPSARMGRRHPPPSPLLRPRLVPQLLPPGVDDLGADLLLAVALPVDRDQLGTGRIEGALDLARRQVAVRAEELLELGRARQVDHLLREVGCLGALGDRDPL